MQIASRQDSITVDEDGCVRRARKPKIA